MRDTSSEATKFRHRFFPNYSVSTVLKVREQSQRLTVLGVERRIWWFTVANTAERSNRMTTEDREAVLVWSSSVTARRAVSVEWPT